MAYWTAEPAQPVRPAEAVTRRRRTSAAAARSRHRQRKKEQRVPKRRALLSFCRQRPISALATERLPAPRWVVRWPALHGVGDFMYETRLDSLRPVVRARRAHERP